MSKKIFKYSVPINDEITKHFHRKVLHVGQQADKGELVFWAESEEGWNYDYEYRVLGTGMDVPQGMWHVGSVQSSNGLVWHLYERFGEY